MHPAKSMREPIRKKGSEKVKAALLKVNKLANIANKTSTQGICLPLLNVTNLALDPSLRVVTKTQNQVYFLLNKHSTRIKSQLEGET